MKAIKFDEALSKAGFEGLVKKAGLNLNSGHFLGGIVKYFIIVVFLIASFDVLGLTQVTAFLRGVVVDYLPHVIVAALVLLVGGVVGDVVARIVNASAKSAGISSANFVSTVSKWAVWVFAILVALSQRIHPDPFHGLRSRSIFGSRTFIRSRGTGSSSEGDREGVRPNFFPSLKTSKFGELLVSGLKMFVTLCSIRLLTFSNTQHRISSKL
jgi:hypothetical protein